MSKLGKVGEGRGLGEGTGRPRRELFLVHCLSGRTLTLKHSGGFGKLPLAQADKAVASPSPSLPTFSYLSGG